MGYPILPGGVCPGPLQRCRGVAKYAKRKNHLRLVYRLVDKRLEFAGAGSGNRVYFSSPLDDHINVKVVKERCWPNASNIERFEIEKFAVNGDEAFVISKGWNKAGGLLRNTDYFRIKDGKIQAYECFFGPGINFPNSGK